MGKRVNQNVTNCPSQKCDVLKERPKYQTSDIKQILFHYKALARFNESHSSHEPCNIFF